MPFKYYAYTVNGMDGWVELSNAVQKKLRNFDNYARDEDYRWILYGTVLDLGVLAHAPGRRAEYTVTAFSEEDVPDRHIEFDDGEMVEVRYVQERPPLHEIGFHVPARV